MNFNEAQELLRKSGYRVINEMAKAARNRIIDRLTPKKKAVYLLGRFFEKNGAAAANATLGQLKKYVEAKQPVVGIDWQTFLTELGGNITGNPHLSNTPLPRRNTEYANLYQNILTTIERSKDQIDRDYVDNIYSFYKATQNGMAPSEAYTQYNLEPAIAWLKRDETEAAERFGVRWPLIKKSLRRYWDDNFAGSPDEAFALFGNWYRAKKNRQTLPELSAATKDALVNIALTDGAEETFGNLVWTLRRTATEWLDGQTLEQYREAHPVAANAAAEEAEEEEAPAAGGRRRWTIRYIASGDHDVTSVWTEADDIRSAIDDVMHEYHDIEEIISVSQG